MTTKITMMKQINNSEKRTLLEVGTQCKIIHLQVVALLVLTIALKTDVQAQGSAPCIVFNQTEYDYGTINQHGSGICTFTFKNTGNAPLVISGASSSCGCTTPMFDRKPIIPGKTGHFIVRYNTSK